MPLLRGSIVGYDAARMSFEFTMVTTGVEMVECSISSAALDHLAGQKGTVPAEREEQFRRFRDDIERFASDLYDAKVVPVRIFSKHVDARKPRGRK
jgi:hypothetical protein